MDKKELEDRNALKQRFQEDGRKLMHYFDAFIIDLISLLSDDQ